MVKFTQPHKYMTSNPGTVESLMKAGDKGVGMRGVAPRSRDRHAKVAHATDKLISGRTHVTTHPHGKY